MNNDANEGAEVKTVNPFYSAKATPEALEKMMEIREAYKALGDLIAGLNATGSLGVGGREKSLAITNLEQSAMWAIKSISHYNVAE